MAIHWKTVREAIDCKHIAIESVPDSGSFYFNYKGYNSIVLIASVDANYTFIYVDIGLNERISDGEYSMHVVLAKNYLQI